MNELPKEAKVELSELEYSKPSENDWRKASMDITTKCPNCKKDISWDFSYSVRAPTWHKLLITDIKWFFRDLKTRMRRGEL